MALAKVLQEELGVRPLTLKDLQKACVKEDVSEIVVGCFHLSAKNEYFRILLG